MLGPWSTGLLNLQASLPCRRPRTNIKTNAVLTTITITITDSHMAALHLRRCLHLSRSHYISRIPSRRLPRLLHYRIQRCSKTEMAGQTIRLTRETKRPMAEFLGKGTSPSLLGKIITRQYSHRSIIQQANPSGSQSRRINMLRMRKSNFKFRRMRLNLACT